MALHPFLLIAPVFHRFSPLPDGELNQELHNLAASLKFPLINLFVVDESPRLTYDNAYTYGLFKNKHIVLYDTLIQQCSIKEIAAVVAYKLGHWKLNQGVYCFIYFQTAIFLQRRLYTFVRNSKDLHQSFGFEAQPVIVSLVVFDYTIAPVHRLFVFGLYLVTRAFDFQADALGKKLGYATFLQAAIVKLQLEDHLSAMNIDPWYSANYYSHPSLLERLSALKDSCKQKAD